MFHEEGRDEALQSGFGWKDAGDAGAPFEFLVEAFEAVGGAESAPVCFWEGEDGQGFGDVGFQPGAEFGGGLLPFLSDGLEACFGFGTVQGIEDGKLKLTRLNQ